MVNNIYLTSELRSTTTFTAHCGNALIKTCEVEIGGQKIDKHYAQWLQIYNELSGAYGDITQSLLNSAGTVTAPNEITNLLSRYGSPQADVMGETPALANNDNRRVYVPLRFWFCNNPGLALPLIALQYHEVKIKITFGSSTDMGYDSISNSKLLVDYIYLDTD